MELPGRAIDFQMNLDLSGTDFLALVRDRDTADASPAARRADPKSGSRQVSVVARFSTSLDTLTLTGLINRRYPVNLLLKSGSKSYTNFLTLLVREIEELLALEETQLESAAASALRDLGEHLNEILGKISEQSHSQSIDEFVDLYRGDFEAISQGETVDVLKLPQPSDENKFGVRIIDEKTGRSLLQAPWSHDLQKFRYFSGQAPQLISGFVALEPLADELKQDFLALEDEFDWKQGVVFDQDPKVIVGQQSVGLVASIYIPEELIGSLEFFVHWGPNTPDAAWQDEEISPAEMNIHDTGIIEISKELLPEKSGSYSLCFCVQRVGSRERIWASEHGIGDSVFYVPAALVNSAMPIVREERFSDVALKSKLLKALSSFESFARLASQIMRSGEERRLGKLLFEVTKDDDELRELVSLYYEEAIYSQETEKPLLPRSILARTASLLSNIGIGETVLVTPEGPHAIAGGLAQVVVGLTKSLSREHVATTVISPLYENAQGSKHQAAKDVIKNGVQIIDQIVPLVHLGQIKIPFGETRQSGTTSRVQFPRLVTVQVYRAEYGYVRMFFLRHHTLADSLYQFASGEDQLRKAIFLSRGALELIRSRRFGISPDTIISNDWVSSLIPVYLKCDSRYANRGPFVGVETAHIIHNAGGAFQGKMYINQFGEDLWPLLQLEDQHFFGLADQSDSSKINFTQAAVLHSSKAVITVSKPYAQQLLTKEGGEGLDEELKKRRRSVFGISNGVDLSALRNTFYQLGEAALKDAGKSPLLPSRSIRQARIVEMLDQYKSVVKSAVQRKYGLVEDTEAVLVSLVGRLTEQKGVQLLARRALGSNDTVLEEMLRRFSHVQFLFAGPIAQADPDVAAFAELVTALGARHPGRIRGIFDFIPHRNAIETTLASDFFLMPSRYEPGGITQLEALAAGTVVIGHNVGGIAATLTDASEVSGLGNSFLFQEFSATALRDVLRRAVFVYKQPRKRNELFLAAANAKHDWTDRVPTYLALLQHMGGALSSNRSYSHLRARRNLLQSISA